MAIDFPSSPTNGQIYTINNKTWVYDGEKWLAQSTLASTVSDLQVEVAMQTF